MRILILGGTLFLGRHLVKAALVQGHTVALFNRGQSNADIFPEIEKLRGDRTVDMSALRGRIWDAVIDTSGYIPRAVEAGATLLRESTRHYAFVSSLTVYADLSLPDIREDAPLLDLEPFRAEQELTPQSYGPLKALCEQAVEEAFGARALIARPGLIVGAHDYTNRSAYWVQRLADGGEVLAPGMPDRRIQLIDARDLASWLVRMAEAGQGGVYNVTGPEQPLTMGQFLASCTAVVSGEATLTWVDGQFLVDRDVAYWSELPLWLPESVPWRLDISKAIQSGLEFQPIDGTMLTYMHGLALAVSNGLSNLCGRAAARWTLASSERRKHLCWTSGDSGRVDTPNAATPHLAPRSSFRLTTAGRLLIVPVSAHLGRHLSAARE